MEKYPSENTKLQFKLHPRVFAALGADLITNDVVAVLELVKNSYDALATRVDIRFNVVNKKVTYLEIEDNGYGMNWGIIKNVWCMVATPFRSDNPVSKKEGITRRASGEKGLGRLSVARLGDRLVMFTKTESEPCWKVSVNWSNLASEKSVESCFVDAGPNDGEIPFKKTGTRIRVYDLKSEWDNVKLSDLTDNLSRLISPFAKIENFRIFLSHPDFAPESEQIEISAPKFLSKPKYVIKGQVDIKGIVDAYYQYSPIKKGTGKPRATNLKLTWEQIIKQNEELFVKFKGKDPQCGLFDFEIRAWDIGFEDTEEIAFAFDENKSQIRKAIRAHKGISVYRDGILVLPKSEDARDWLGLDIRRVSKVGTRLSTSQLVGYVSISSESNSQLQDKSDREGLGANDAVVAFQAILNAIVYQLENERDKDRIKPSDEEKLMDLFEDLTADDLLAEVVTIADEGAPAKDAIPILKKFNKKIEFIKTAIKKRFVYYSRLATIGTIAQMIVHEIRNRTTIFGSFVRYITKHYVDDSSLTPKVEQAMNAIVSMERLADTFAPLASRSFRRGTRNSILEESIKRCMSFVTKDIEEMNIKVYVPNTETRVAVDPGELDAIILNLINNAIYWLMQVKRDRRLEFRLSQIGLNRRVKLTIHDSGPGVSEEETKKIFLPGFTKKPGGIGMGLTVASELIAEYGGEIFLSQPGKLGGASFTFDMPLKV